jgi:hypothetical protein
MPAAIATMAVIGLSTLASNAVSAGDMKAFGKHVHRSRRAPWP